MDGITSLVVRERIREWTWKLANDQAVRAGPGDVMLLERLAELLEEREQIDDNAALETTVDTAREPRRDEHMGMIEWIFETACHEH